MLEHFESELQNKILLILVGDQLGHLYHLDLEILGDQVVPEPRYCLEIQIYLLAQEVLIILGIHLAQVIL